MKKRHCWPYEQGNPALTVTFLSQGITLTKTLQVDTGFSGWFLVDWETFKFLQLQRSELPRDLWPQAQGFGGQRRLRGGYLTVALPELGFRQPHVVYSAPRLGGEWNLVGLRFLDQFLWSGDGQEFCLTEQ
jgi:hypothetical protein